MGRLNLFPALYCINCEFTIEWDDHKMGIKMFCTSSSSDSSSSSKLSSLVTDNCLIAWLDLLEPTFVGMIPWKVWMTVQATVLLYLFQIKSNIDVIFNPFGLFICSILKQASHGIVSKKRYLIVVKAISISSSTKVIITLRSGFSQLIRFRRMDIYVQ